MRWITGLAIAMLLCGCGDDESGSNTNGDANAEANNADNNSATPDGWWIEIEGSGLTRDDLSGGIVVASVGSPSSIRGDELFSKASFSFVTPDDLSVPGTYTTESVTIHDREEPEHFCGADGLTVEVLSGDPFEANLSGMASCWEGDSLGDPADAVVQGATLTGYIKE